MKECDGHEVERLAPAVVETARDLSKAAGGTVRLPVSGASMSPLLRQGDVVVVRMGQGGPRLGDVVVRRQGEALVVHRVVRVTGSCFVTKGDAVLTADPPAGEEDILGIVTAVEGAVHVDLTRGIWRGVNPVLAVYSRSVAGLWKWMSAWGRRWLPRQSLPGLWLARRALLFAFKVPLYLLLQGIRLCGVGADMLKRNACGVGEHRQEG